MKMKLETVKKISIFWIATIISLALITLALGGEGYWLWIAWGVLIVYLVAFMTVFG